MPPCLTGTASRSPRAGAPLSNVKMPLLLRRTAAQKSSRCSPEALYHKAFGAFDPIRGGPLPPRASLPKLNQLLLNRAFGQTALPASKQRPATLFSCLILPYFWRSYIRCLPLWSGPPALEHGLHLLPGTAVVPLSPADIGAGVGVLPHIHRPEPVWSPGHKDGHHLVAAAL